MIERAYGVDCRNGDVNQDVNGTLQAKPGGVSLNTNIVALIPCRTRDLCAGRSPLTQCLPPDISNLDVGRDLE